MLELQIGNSDVVVNLIEFSGRKPNWTIWIKYWKSIFKNTTKNDVNMLKYYGEALTIYLSHGLLLKKNTRQISLQCIGVFITFGGFWDNIIFKHTMKTLTL